MEFDPRLGPGHRRPRTRRQRRGLVCDWGSLAVSLASSSNPAVAVGGAVAMTVTPERPLTVALGVAYQEPLVHVEPAAAYAALVDDERRWHAWCAEVDADVAHRDGRSQPPDPAPVDLLPVGRAGRRPHDLPARGNRRRAQLGLPVRLAP